MRNSIAPSLSAAPATYDVSLQVQATMSQGQEYCRDLTMIMAQVGVCHGSSVSSSAVIIDLEALASPHTCSALRRRRC